MSAPEVAAECVKRIESGKYDVVILNFANCDIDVYKRQTLTCTLFSAFRGEKGAFVCPGVF